MRELKSDLSNDGMVDTALQVKLLNVYSSTWVFG